MKAKNVIRVACIGFALYAVCRCAIELNSQNNDSTDISEILGECSENKKEFREKLEADIRTSEANR